MPNGYIGIGPEKGKYVPEEAAFNYAITMIKKDPELRKGVVDYFYSGNWVEDNGEERS